MFIVTTDLTTGRLLCWTITLKNVQSSTRNNPHCHSSQLQRSLSLVFFICSAYYIYDLYHINIISLSSYNGYKLNSLFTYYQQGFITQSVEHRTSIAEVMGSNPIEAQNFFWAFFLQLLKLLPNCEDHFELYSSLCWTSVARNLFSQKHTVLLFFVSLLD